MAHYSSSSANALYAGDILVILDTVEAVTDQLRSELETIPTLDQRRALVTQVSFGLLKVWPRAYVLAIFFAGKMCNKLLFAVLAVCMNLTNCDLLG